MVEFKAEEFLETINWEKFDELKKPDLLAFAQHYDLKVKQATRKQIIKNALIDVLVGEDIFDESYLEEKLEVEIGGDSAFKLKELEIQLELRKMAENLY